MVTRAEEGGARTGAAARSWLGVIPWHAIHVEEGGDAAGLHSHQIAPNTCKDTHTHTQYSDCGVRRTRRKHLGFCPVSVGTSLLRSLEFVITQASSGAKRTR